MSARRRLPRRELERIVAAQRDSIERMAKTIAVQGYRIEQLKTERDEQATRAARAEAKEAQ